MQWFVVHVSTGHEQKIKRYLTQYRDRQEGDIGIGRIIVDTNDYIACFTSGEPIVESQVITPGYIYIEADSNPQRILPRFGKTRCYVMGVVPEHDITAMNPFKGLKSPVVKVGDRVRVVFGLFQGVIGTIVKIEGDMCKVSPVNMHGKLEIETKLLQPA